MVILLGAGALALIMGALFIFAPDMLRRLNDRSMRAFTDFDRFAFSYRFGFGAALLIAGAFLVASALVLKGRLP